MKIAAVLAVLVVGVLVSAPAAEPPSPVLTVGRAEVKARAEALLVAGQMRERPAVHLVGCERRERALVDCSVRYRFREAGGRCFQTIRVRLVGGRLRVSFPGRPRC